MKQFRTRSIPKAFVGEFSSGFAIDLAADMREDAAALDNRSGVCPSCGCDIFTVAGVELECPCEGIEASAEHLTAIYFAEITGYH
jgi:hypothetical protein